MEKRLPTRAGSRKRVDPQKGYRYVTPAVRLERKQISMLNPPPGPSQPPSQPPTPEPHPVSASDASARTTIVGKKGPLEEEGSSLVPRAAPPPNGESLRHSTEEPATATATAAPSSPPSSSEQQVPPPDQELTGTRKHQKEEKEPEPELKPEPETEPEQEEERRRRRKAQRTEEEATRTEELSQGTQEETQVTRQEHTQEPQAPSSRTSTTTGVRTTPTTERVDDAPPSSPPAKDEGSRGPSSTTTTTTKTTAGRPNVQFAVQPVTLETADLLEFFEEQPPARKDSSLQIAEQSVRPETATVMEFFEGQPLRQQGVHVPRSTASQETAEVIEFFEEQDHSLEEVRRPSLLTVPGPQHHGGSLPRSQRSPSPGSLHSSVGLSHLDNLIRLMEQLSNLRDENAKLRKKCDYLETTKNLLKARSELMSTSDSSSASGYQSLPPSRHKGHQHRHHHRNGSGTRDAEGGRPRLFSAEDVQCLEISESASDSRPKRPKAPMHKRSFSTGSLEVEILDETSTSEGGRIPKSKSGKSVVGAKSPKQKSKGSKWARVKKVLTGQFWYEDLGTTLKSLKELGRSAQRYSSVGTEGHEFGSSTSSSSHHHHHHHHHHQQQQRSLDTSLEGADLLTSSSSSSRLPRVASAAEASSAAATAGRSPHNVPGSGEGGGGGGVEELGTEIWMGPPGWWEQYEASRRGQGGGEEASNSSDVSSVIEVKTMYLGSKQKDTERLLKVKTLTRRQSSPSLTTKSAAAGEAGQEDGGGGGEEGGEEEVVAGEGGQGGDGGAPVHRSVSYKDEAELELPKEAMSAAPVSTAKPDSKKLHRKAWGRVKDIIHVRKDSVKKRSRRSAGGTASGGGVEREKESSEWSQGEEISEVDMEGLMEEQLSGEFGEGIVSRSTPKTSPLVVPRQPPSKSFSESPPQQQQGTDPSFVTSSSSSKMVASSSAGGTEMAALLASSLSEEFTQKLQAWQEMQLRKSSSFKMSSGGGGGESAESESRAAAAATAAATAHRDHQVVGGIGLESQELLLSTSSQVAAPPAATTAASTTSTTATATAATLHWEGAEAPERSRAKGAPPGQQQQQQQPLLSQPEAEAPLSSAAAAAALTQAEPSPTELQAPSSSISPAAINVEELQRGISESFSRKLTEWERRKYRRPTTPEMEHKGSSSRGRKEKEKEKEERSRSKKSREEKERERQEKLREREMQKVEKEQVKLEKEKVRIEKERQRAMERQAKLERMKGRLSQADTEAASSPPPGAVPAPTSAQDTMTAQYKVTADFKRKLDEWHQMKTSLTLPPDPAGTSSDGGTPSPQPAPSASPPPFGGGGGGGGGVEGRPPPLSLQPYYPDTPEERSPVDKASDVSYGDDSTSVTEESGHTRSNITSLERANSELLREVEKKEEEYAMLQEEVHKLNSKLDKVRQEHAAEMARFRRELEAGTVQGPVQLEVGELESTVRELEEKIALMENAGDQLAQSMETAAIGKWQSVEGEEVVSQQLVDMVEQMKSMLVTASTTREHAQRMLALHNFEKVYCHAMKLQVQMNNLRVSQLERNKEIMLIKRQLLLQEVNNVLLQAHITRRETELYQYRESRRYHQHQGAACPAMEHLLWTGRQRGQAAPAPSHQPAGQG
ncbi:uncharacterized protein LOC143292725 isoform X2 [Babylonia areolata]|uniref:uncharacterized protein LOC143292725 isoform X2 n=1 Tax=Babylonia areolata TaxID=304850 RepID=UPI003FD575F2